jgi:hypothetical protein
MQAEEMDPERVEFGQGVHELAQGMGEAVVAINEDRRSCLGDNMFNRDAKTTHTNSCWTGKRFRGINAQNAQRAECRRRHPTRNAPSKFKGLKLNRILILEAVETGDSG